MSHCGQLPYLVGAASVDITPPLEVGLLMSSVEGRWAPFEGTRLPLMARALFLTHGDTQAALVSLDLLGLESTSVGGFDRFKERIVAAADFVVRADELLITSTHTHTAPESIGLTDLCETQAFQDWIEALARSIGQAIRRAARHAVPAQLALGMARAPELCLHRRIRTRRGILLSHPMPPADIILPGTGPVDDSVNVALFLGADARPVGIVVNATCHPVHEMCLPFISPDYPGELCNLLAGELGCEALFLNGAAGNINPPTVSDGPAAAQAHAARLHRAVLEAMQNTVPSRSDSLQLLRQTLELPARDAEGRPVAEPIEADIAALRVGDAGFVFLPGEPFVETGLGIRERAPCLLTFIVGGAGAYIGYVPTDKAFSEGGYETGPGRWSRLLPGSEPLVRERCVKLIAQAAGRDVPDSAETIESATSEAG